MHGSPNHLVVHGYLFSCAYWLHSWKRPPSFWLQGGPLMWRGQMCGPWVWSPLKTHLHTLTASRVASVYVVKVLSYTHMYYTALFSHTFWLCGRFIGREISMQSGHYTTTVYFPIKLSLEESTEKNSNSFSEGLPHSCCTSTPETLAL